MQRIFFVKRSTRHDLFDHELAAAEHFPRLPTAMRTGVRRVEQTPDLAAGAAARGAGQDLDLQLRFLQQSAIDGGGVAGLEVMRHHRRQLPHLQYQRVDLAHAVLRGEGLDRADHVEHDAQFVHDSTCPKSKPEPAGRIQPDPGLDQPVTS